MIRTDRTSSGRLRHALAALALIAICLKAMIPAGYMVAKPTNDLPFAIVLCTAQGAVTLAAGDKAQHPGDDEAQTADHAPCPFAAFAMDTPPPSLLAVETVTFAAYASAAPATAPAVSPGQGLAAPPLPARGPPSLLA